MLNLRPIVIRLAHERADLRTDLLRIVQEGRVATEFPTENALKKYLSDHPDADKSKHSVKPKAEKAEKAEKKDEGGGKAPDHSEHLKGVSPAHRKIVDDMPAKPMDKEEGYNHPKVKAAIKELKKLPLATVQKMYRDLETKMDTLGRAVVDARVDGKPESERESLRAAYGQVQQAWRASNQAIAEMGDEKKERDDKGGVDYRYLPRAELKKRSKVPYSFKDKLEKWEGVGKNDPVFRVLDEMRVHTYVPHAKLEKALEHLTSLADSPHHADDKDEILKLRDDLAKETGRLVKKGADLRDDLIRLAHARPELRAHLLPILREAGQDADSRYQANVKDIKDKLRQVAQLVASHATDQKKQAWDWGYVGDLAYVNERLDEVLEFLKDAGSSPHDENYSSTVVSLRHASDGGYEHAIGRFDGMLPGGFHEKWVVIHDENGATKGNWAVVKGHGMSKNLPQLLRYYPSDQFAEIVDLRKVRVSG